MNDNMLLAVLKMPPNCWSDSPVDEIQRHRRYLQAANRIEELKTALLEACKFREALCRNSNIDDDEDPKLWDETLIRWLKVVDGE